MTATPAYAVPLRKGDSNIGFETNKEYFDIAQQRIDDVRRNPTLF